MSPARRGGSPCLFPLQLFSLCWVLSVAQSKTVRYSTFEEDAPGTVIGTLAEDLHMKVSGDTSFRLMKQFNSSLIRVREGDGQLTVGDAGLDRERLCGQAPQCVLAFDVVSFSQEQFRLVHVEVSVRDINDHAPRFPRAQIPVEVSEGAAVGTRIPLEVPVDEDVGANGLQSVRLAEPHSPFRVELQTRADGAQCADLVLLQELDRESQATYSLGLVAQDGGRPPRSATAALSVHVLDANDHGPAFPQGAVAEVELAEDAPVGSLLLDLDAADPDEGPNGDVVFAFGARTPPEARRLFRLDPRSGRLTLAGPVDYERQDTYELDVGRRTPAPGPAPPPARSSCASATSMTTLRTSPSPRWPPRARLLPRPSPPPPPLLGERRPPRRPGLGRRRRAPSRWCRRGRLARAWWRWSAPRTGTRVPMGRCVAPSTGTSTSGCSRPTRAATWW